MRRTKLDQRDIPEYINIPENEDDLDKLIRDSTTPDPSIDDLFHNAETLAAKQGAECTANQRLHCLLLIVHEMEEARRRLWEAVLATEKMRKALEAATDKADDIVAGINNNIVTAQNTPVPVKVQITDADVSKLQAQHDSYVRTEQDFLATQKNNVMNAAYKVSSTVGTEIRRAECYVIPKGSLLVWTFVVSYATTVSLIVYLIVSLFK